MRDLSKEYHPRRSRSRSVSRSRAGTYLPPSMQEEEVEMAPSVLKTPLSITSNSRLGATEFSMRSTLATRQTRDELPPRRVFLSERRNEGSATASSLECMSSTSNLTDVSSKIEASISPDSRDPSLYHIMPPTMDPDVRLPSPKHRANLEAWYRKRSNQTSSTRHISNTRRVAQAPPKYTDNTLKFIYSDHVLSNENSDASDEEDESYLGSGTFDETIGSKTFNTFDDKPIYEVTPDHDDDFLKTKIEIPFASIVVMSIQLLILITQLAMCGIARLDVNPMVGPYPDAFSEWGGKNAYLMLQENQWWRLVTASLLHVGVLHLLVNALCICWIISFFEREWGSIRWMLVFLLSSVGCNAAACAGEADTIGVGSSGALMGLYAAKLAQVLSHTCFAVRKDIDDAIRFDQLIGVFFGIAVEAIMSSLTYIDGWGHVGGVVTGFFSGLILFSNPIVSCCSRFFWRLIGLLGLGGSFAAVGYFLVVYVEPSEDIGNPCEYFRNLFPEGYNCECAW